MQVSQIRFCDPCPCHRFCAKLGRALHSAAATMQDAQSDFDNLRFQQLGLGSHTPFQILQQEKSHLHPRLYTAEDLYSWSARLCRAGTKQGEHSTVTRSRDGISKSMWWICRIYTAGAIVRLQPLKSHAPIIGVAHPLCRQIWRWKSRCNLPGREARSGQWEQTVEFGEGKKWISCLVSIGPAWLQGFWGACSMMLQHWQQFNEVFGILPHDNGFYVKAILGA